MKVAFIGAGKVATSMGCYLKGKGKNIIGYASRSYDSALKAAKKTKSKGFQDVEELINSANLIFITTTDDAILKVSNELALKFSSWDKKVVCHMSGVHSSEILDALLKKGATICSMHPMLSFGDIEASIIALEKTYFTIEGIGSELYIFKEFISSCGNTCIEISPDNKILYHVAACVVSNYLVSLLDIGIDMLKSTGFNEQEAIKLIEPLVNKTVDNVITMGTGKSLTGPISRGDIDTVTIHLEKLNTYNKNIVNTYKNMGVHTTKLAERNQMIDKSTAADLMDLFKT